jgi:uncharacterized membrane protein
LTAEALLQHTGMQMIPLGRFFNLKSSYLTKLTLGLLALLSLALVQPAWAQEQAAPDQSFAKATVQSVDKEGTKDINGFSNLYQEVTLKILDGPDKDQIIHLEHGGISQITAGQKVHAGETVVLTTFTDQDGHTEHIIVDSYRLPWLAIFGIIFVFFVLAVTGLKGLGSLAGLVFSLAVITFWVAPQILHGQDPLLISIAGSFVILLLTTYLAHGVSRQTTMALVSTFAALIITGLLSIAAVYMTKMTGVSSDEVYSLQLNQTTANINTQGLLLGGIIIGMVGALNDVTTTQAATVFELVHSMSKPTFPHVVRRSLIVGREHILSLVNTLVLAYAGSSLAVFLFLVLNPSGQPLWVMLNSETLFDEAVRTIIGSFGLILAVPLVTFLATWSALRKEPTEAELARASHHH